MTEENTKALTPIDHALDHIKEAKRELERLGPSREKSLAVTKLDEALLWIGAMP